MSRFDQRTKAIVKEKKAQESERRAGRNPYPVPAMRLGPTHPDRPKPKAQARRVPPEAVAVCVFGLDVTVRPPHRRMPLTLMG
eukprot:9630238-Lingulodinium_polyedra.AAC.1